MMQKVEILDAGDTNFLEIQLVDRWVFREDNDKILNMKVVEESGDSETSEARYDRIGTSLAG